METSIRKIKVRFGIRNEKDKLKQESNELKKFLIDPNASIFDKSLVSRSKTIEDAVPTNKGQDPDVLVIANAGLDLTKYIYDGKLKVNNGKSINGVFGNVGDSDNDYAQFAYMINHLIHSHKKIPFLVFFTYDSPVDTINIIKRKDKFLEEYKKSGRLIDEKGLVIAYEKENVIVEPIILLYNKQENKFYEYDERTGEKSHISELKKISTANNHIKDEFVDGLLKAETMNEMLTLDLAAQEEIMSVGCCDSRTHNYGGIGFAARRLGTLFTRDEIKKILRTRSGAVVQEVHTTCGYLTSAVMMYRLLKELSKTNEQIRTAVMENIQNAYHSNGKLHLDISYLNTAIERKLLHEEDRNLFQSMFVSPTNDYQNILMHMIDLGVIKIMNSDNRINMPPYEVVTNILKERNEYIDFKVLVYLVTEEIARNQAQIVREEFDRLIAKGGHSEITEWYIVMHSLVDQTRYRIPETLSLSMEKYTRTNEFGETKEIRDIV